MGNLSKEELKALRSFHNSVGDRWKYVLTNDYWAMGRNPHGISSDHLASLQSIRNRLGPSWLFSRRAGDLIKFNRKEYET